MPANVNAALVAPSLWPSAMDAAIKTNARIQMVMPTIKTISQKKHAENHIKWQPVSRLKIIFTGLKFERTHAFTATFVRSKKISIIIPAFNEERLLGESLAQIKSAADAFTHNVAGNLN